MTNKLQQYFPMIRTRNQVLEEIQRKQELLAEFESWKEEQQEEFLDFCAGVRGVKILYDVFFKEIFSPEYHSERMEGLLSQLLKKKVRIRQVLPNDSVRLTDENTLLITDIVVELEDGSLANIEVQKIGYAFPGQRVACYSADMLLRQYKRVKSIRKQKFTYRDIKNVYTIVFFEKSTEEFHKIKDSYIHCSKQVFDTGLVLDTLQEFILIPLDIFKDAMHNKTIDNELEAWLTFLVFDRPEKMVELIETYPQFKAMYEEIYDICRNVEEVMGMFSKGLAELDRNTVQYMIEEQEKRLSENKKKLNESEKKLSESEKKLSESEKKLSESEKKLSENRERLNEKTRQLEAKEQEIAELKRRLEELSKKA
ncbi:PD-(D/E)XK nuclease family transposase [Roseburia hominis]